MKLCDGRYSLFCETNSSGNEDSKYLFYLIQKGKLRKGQKLHFKNLEFIDLNKSFRCYEGFKQTNHPIIDFSFSKGIKIHINSMAPCYRDTKLGFHKEYIFKKLSLLKIFGGKTCFLDCVVVKKYTHYYQGTAPYHSKT